MWVGISAHPLLQTSINTAIATTFESCLAFYEILHPQQAGEEKMGLSLPTQREAAVQTSPWLDIWVSIHENLATNDPATGKWPMRPCTLRNFQWMQQRKKTS